MSGPGSWPQVGPPGSGRSRRARFPAGLLAGLLPADVAVVDALDGSFDGDRLTDFAGFGTDVAFDAEFDALGDAAPRRRQDFARARICAHAALVALGRPAVAIGMGEQREPCWPAGVVGSITHCAGYRAAAAAAATDVLAVGLDAEPDRALPAEVAQLAFTAADREGSGPLARFRNWDRAAFSARESVFKAWFAVTGRRLEFADATLFLFPDEPSGGNFRASIGADVPGVQALAQACGSSVLTGRYRWTREWAPASGPGLVVAAVTLRHRDAAAL